MSRKERAGGSGGVRIGPVVGVMVGLGIAYGAYELGKNSSGTYLAPDTSPTPITRSTEPFTARLTPTQVIIRGAFNLRPSLTPSRVASPYSEVVGTPTAIMVADAESSKTPTKGIEAEDINVITSEAIDSEAHGDPRNGLIIETYLNKNIPKETIEEIEAFIRTDNREREAYALIGLDSRRIKVHDIVPFSEIPLEAPKYFPGLTTEELSKIYRVGGGFKMAYWDVQDARVRYASLVMVDGPTNEGLGRFSVDEKYAILEYPELQGGHPLRAMLVNRVFCSQPQVPGKPPAPPKEKEIPPKVPQKPVPTKAPTPVPKKVATPTPTEVPPTPTEVPPTITATATATEVPPTATATNTPVPTEIKPPTKTPEIKTPIPTATRHRPQPTDTRVPTPFATATRHRPQPTDTRVPYNAEKAYYENQNKISVGSLPSRWRGYKH